MHPTASAIFLTAGRSSVKCSSGSSCTLAAWSAVPQREQTVSQPELWPERRRERRLTLGDHERVALGERANVKERVAAHIIHASALACGRRERDKGGVK